MVYNHPQNSSYSKLFISSFPPEIFFTLIHFSQSSQPFQAPKIAWYVILAASLYFSFLSIWGSSASYNTSFSQCSQPPCVFCCIINSVEFTPQLHQIAWHIILPSILPLSTGYGPSHPVVLSCLSHRIIDSIKLHIIAAYQSTHFCR